MRFLCRLFRREPTHKRPSLWRRFLELLLGEALLAEQPQAEDAAIPVLPEPSPEPAAPASAESVPVPEPAAPEPVGSYTLRQMPMIPRPDGPSPEDRLGTMPIYTYVGVVFPKANIVYHYRTMDKTIAVGNEVLVPVMRRGILKEATGVVVSVGQYLPIGVPYPVSQTRTVIRKL